MEFEKRRKIEVLEPAHETLMRQWRKDRNSKVVEKYLKSPELRTNQELNRLMYVLLGEWESLLRTVFYIATDPIELERIERKIIRGQLGDRIKINQIPQALDMIKNLRLKLWREIINRLMDYDLLDIYSDSLKLTIKQITALTIYVLKLHTDLSNRDICRIVNTLRMENYFDPYGPGPDRIRARWNDYQKPGRKASKHYTELQILTRK